MPRRVRVRDANDDVSGPRDEARRQWLTTWKAWAVERVPAGVSSSIKVQLRVDVERALDRHRPDDDESEIRDLVSSLVEATLTRLGTELAGQLQQAARQIAISHASTYLRNGLAKCDRHHVTAMLKRPGFSSAALTARLERYLARHVKGDEDVPEIQGLVDAWVARRLGEQPPAPGNALGKASAAVAAVGVVAYQHPQLKAAMNAAVSQGLAKARQFVQKWRTPPPPDESKPS